MSTIFKKNLILSVVLSASAFAAHAQSNVTIYGDLDQYLGYIRSSTGNSVTGINDGSILRSRLGFRGMEDLGNGYQAKFNLEQGLNANSGSSADTTRLFDRQAWVGMNTPYGEVRLGRQNTLIFYAGDAIDYTARTTFGSMINTFGVPSRYDNDISYQTPRMSGLQLSVHYALPENATATVNNKALVQLGADYQNGPYRFGYAGLEASPNAVTATFTQKVVYHNVYADYDYGQGKIYYAFVRSNNVTGNSSGNDATAILSNINNPNNFFPGTDANVNRFYNINQISVDYRVSTKLRVGALYGVIDDTSGGNTGASGGNVGVFYDLSSRTTLYSFANYMKNQANAGFRFSGSAGPSANLSGTDINGKGLTGLQAGILFRF